MGVSFWPVFAAGSHRSWDRLLSLGVVEAGARCVSVFIPDHTGSFKSPVQLLLWKKTCFLLGWILWVQQEKHKQVTADALITAIYSGNSDKSSITFVVASSPAVSICSTLCEAITHLSSAWQLCKALTSVINLTEVVNVVLYSRFLRSSLLQRFSLQSLRRLACQMPEFHQS